ncbi:MAG: class I SAM-dependent methyltransferase [Geminocystis sp.]|nr:class I SAM-dependent methyltransferase [Geminocystis sp.]
MPVCPSCETSVPDEKYLETYTASFNNQEYKLYHCPKCDLQWWEPLKIVPEYYEQEGEEAYAIFHTGINQTIGENHKMFFKHMPLKSGRLLDVGCGDGVFIAEAQRRGYEVWGIDFDRKSIQVCQEKRGLKNTFAMTPWEFAEFCQKENLKFDIVTFFEVLEHQDRPREFLEAVKSMLKPGGWIAGSVPNRESFWTKLSGRFLGNWDFPPHHLIRFNSQSLRNFLNEYSNDIKIDYTVLNKNRLRAEIAQILLGGKRNIMKIKILVKGDTDSKRSTIRNMTFLFMKTLKNLLVYYPVILFVELSTIVFGRSDTIYFQLKTNEN